MTSLRHLLAPLALGPVELPNRIVSTAHQTTLVHDHLPSDDFVAYHEARARGGAGLIVLEATAVHPSGLLTAHTLGGYLPEIVAGYRRVARAVQPHGTRLFVQLFHGGREQISSAPRAPALAPSPVPSPRFRTEPRAARGDELEEIVHGYGRAAGLAAEGGLDGVEVSGAHRYLVEQFFDPELNRRDDGWDGPRLLTEILRAVRAAAPGLCVGVRLSADSARAAAMARVAEAEGVDYVSLALGDSSTYLGSVGVVPPPPITGEAIVQAAKGVPARPPRILNCRLVDVEEADRLVGAGLADAVGMTRALIADPEVAAKARAGGLDEVVRCVGCNACIAHYHAGTAIACAVNPRTGRELRLAAAHPGPRRRVAVVGGGPAGIAAAKEAAALGNEVVLFERGPRLGGQIALAGAAPGGAEVARVFLEDAERHLSLAGVEVRLGEEADSGELGTFDGVIVATGARPFRPPLELEGVRVLDSWEVLAGEVPAGQKVVVADWGGDPSGLDAAELLAPSNTVLLGVAAVGVGEGLHQYRRNLYLQRLYRAGVRIVHHVRLVGATDGRVRFRNVFAPEQETSFDADLLVLALGRVPRDELAPVLRRAGLPVEEAGDCLGPRSLEEAVLEGTLAARRRAGVGSP
jgi:2,4-dienoyl-CoA reductase-like NADH-dependent reductase (Old Yellow Enzyme family)/thioredoxin reductase